jgi:hypothetical protein
MEIRPGTYKVSEIFRIAKFDLAKEAAVDYGDGIDRRRVTVGGLPFSDVDELIHIPVTANEVDIAVDNKSHTKLDVSLNDEDRKQRAYSFEHAADADDNE